MPGHCSYNREWEQHPEYKEWICSVEGDKSKAKCRVCFGREFSIANSGEAQVKAHNGGVKHQKAMADKKKTIQGFFSRRPTAAPGPPAAASLLQGTTDSTMPLNTSMPISSSRPLAGGNQTLKAEILLALKCVESHFSFHSCEGISGLFSAMFPGDHVAETFTCGETKCRYLCQFGLSPHFSDMLRKSVKSDGDFVLLFDESLNKKTQTKQMDILLRLWNHDKVQSRYYTSKFVGHASAEDLLQHFNSAAEGLNYTGLLQVSMDGPNVNWSFFEKLNKQIKEHQDPELINIGSCGLHVLHGAFQTGGRESGWKLDDFLSSLYHLFKDCPARRADYAEVTGCSDFFPLKFCRHRWLENGPVSSRAIVMVESLKTYVSAVNQKKVSRPTNNSYETVCKALKDPLLVAKLAFFNSLSRSVETFLGLYQVDKPMVPFIVSDLEKVVRSIMERFIKPEVLKKATTAYDLLKIDLEKSKLGNKDVQVGFKAESEIKRLRSTKAVSDLDIFQFREGCRKHMTRFVEKTTERSPLKYSIARNLSCLDPRIMANDSTASKTRMKRLLELLVKLKRVDENDVDDVNSLYSEYLRDVVDGEEKQKFKNFDVKEDRVDTLFYQTMASDKRFEKLWKVVRKLLLISHGQASVERGFSVNRQIEKENMSEGMHVALRIISDYVVHVGGILKVPMTKELLASASVSRHRYHQYLEEEKRKKVITEKSLKRKAMMEEVDEMRKKAKLLENDISSLNASAEKFADDAESSRGATSHSLIVKSNSMRRTAKEKATELNRINSEIDVKKQHIGTG